MKHPRRNSIPEENEIVKLGHNPEDDANREKIHLVLWAIRVVRKVELDAEMVEVVENASGQAREDKMEDCFRFGHDHIVWYAVWRVIGNGFNVHVRSTRSIRG